MNRLYEEYKFIMQHHLISDTDGSIAQIPLREPIAFTFTVDRSANHGGGVLVNEALDRFKAEVLLRLSKEGEQ